MKSKKKNNQKLKLIPLSIFLLLVGMGVLGIGHNVKAATYYVDAKANDDSGNGSLSSPKKYIKSGMKLMSAGDTLIIEDGTYTGDSNMIDYKIFLPPSGSAEKGYTTIMAKHPGQVVIDGEGVRRTANIWLRDYFHFDGIIFKNSSGALLGVIAGEGDSRSHIKVTRCGFIESGASQSNSKADAVVFSRVSYGLIEDCFAFGVARYEFFAYASDHIIFRRCVARPDVIWNGNLGGPFRFYDTTHSIMQNCIAIDGNGLYYTPDGSNSGSVPKTFWIDGVDGVSSDKMEGCIGLNNPGLYIYFQGDESVENNAIQNSAFWGAKRGIWTRDTNDIFKVEHCTIGNINDPDFVSGQDAGIISDSSVMAVSTNNIIYGCTWAGLKNVAAAGTDYNCLYANPKTNYEGCSASPHDYCSENGNAINPLTGTPGDGTPALKYLPRIEDGSDLKGAASDGGDIGANILYKIGRDGTLWGDPGYDEVTNEPLWPFPNEDLIKQQMSQYTYDADGDGKPEITGKRGFCADGTGLYGGPITLTSYIWEYLGHPCPADICNYNSSSTPDTIPPTLSNGSPSGTLSANTTSTTLSITTNENVTCKYSTVANTSYDDMPNTFTTTGGTNHSTIITGLTNGNSYTCYVRCQDEAGNANTTDYPISFSIANPTPVYTIDNFISLIIHWLGIGDQNSDVNNDGVVNARDLGIIMHYWK